MSFEEQISNRMFSQQSTEKSYIEKVYSNKDVDELKILVKKENLTREDLMELMYLLSSNESKKVNYDTWTRYYMGKFFVWIREFVAAAEHLYDYEEDLKQNKNLVITTRTQQCFNNGKRLMQHNVKFLADLYLNLMRSTLSIGATGFLEPLKSKFEFVYPPQGGLINPQADRPRGLLST